MCDYFPWNVLIVQFMSTKHFLLTVTYRIITFFVVQSTQGAKMEVVGEGKFGIW